MEQNRTGTSGGNAGGGANAAAPNTARPPEGSADLAARQQNSTQRPAAPPPSTAGTQEWSGVARPDSTAARSNSMKFVESMESGSPQPPWQQQNTAQQARTQQPQAQQPQAQQPQAQQPQTQRPAAQQQAAQQTTPVPSSTTDYPPATVTDSTVTVSTPTTGAYTVNEQTGYQYQQSAYGNYGAVDRSDSHSTSHVVQTSPYVPDRIERSYGQSRAEVVPVAFSSMDLLSDIAAKRRAQLKSNTGMRGALNKVGFSLGLSPAEQRTEDRRGRIRRQLTSPYQIAVVSVKGGVGRTTTAATLGSTFAGLRPDRVVAIDANPDFGDLATRTCRHPYGLTLRDLAQSTHLDAYSAVQSFTSINNADLAVIASPWTTEANDALTGREYGTAVEVLRRHYNLLMVDCGTGVLDSATDSVLQTSDAVIVVTPATVGGVTGAVATLNWLGAHGMQHLIAKSIVAIVHHRPAKPTVEVSAIEKLFATAQRPTCELPYDEHLAEGGEIDLRLLEKETLLAFEELAAWLADGFPGYMTGGGGETVDRGGWI